ncbi:hypothetical protein ABPG77_004443 [Micractinium sp. CCAP 211/92]
MRAVVQRVKSASVEVDGQIVSSIGPGLLCLVGLRDTDTAADADFIARKILGLRMWSNGEGSRAWDQSVVQKGYEVLCVSQFTLFARYKGNKLDFSKAMPPAEARGAYAAFLEGLRRQHGEARVKDGVFGAMMDVSLVNDGPVTILLDSADPGNASLGSAGGSSMGSLSSLDQPA